MESTWNQLSFLIDHVKEQNSELGKLSPKRVSPVAKKYLQSRRESHPTKDLYKKKHQTLKLELEKLKEKRSSISNLQYNQATTAELLKEQRTSEALKVKISSIELSYQKKVRELEEQNKVLISEKVELIETLNEYEKKTDSLGIELNELRSIKSNFQQVEILNRQLKDELEISLKSLEKCEIELSFVPKLRTELSQSEYLITSASKEIEKEKSQKLQLEGAKASLEKKLEEITGISQGKNPMEYLKEIKISKKNLESELQLKTEECAFLTQQINGKLEREKEDKEEIEEYLAKIVEFLKDQFFSYANAPNTRIPLFREFEPELSHTQKRVFKHFLKYKDSIKELKQNLEEQNKVIQRLKEQNESRKELNERTSREFEEETRSIENKLEVQSTCWKELEAIIEKYSSEYKTKGLYTVEAILKHLEAEILKTKSLKKKNEILEEENKRLKVTNEEYSQTILILKEDLNTMNSILSESQLNEQDLITKYSQILEEFDRKHKKFTKQENQNKILLQKLEDFNLSCSICSKKLSSFTLNQLCSETSRHYFTKPKTENPLQLSLFTQLHSLQSSKDLSKLFQALDISNSGTISFASLSSLLSSLSINIEHLSTLLSQYISPEGEILYEYLLSDVSLHPLRQCLSSIYHECQQYSSESIPIQDFRQILTNLGLDPFSIEQATIIANPDSEGQISYHSFIKKLKEMLLALLSISAGIQLSSDCSSFEGTHYFDTSLLECVECGTDQIATEDYLACECAAGLAKSEETKNYPVFLCESCETASPSQDEKECQSCPSSKDETTEECLCDESLYEVVLEIDIDGTYLSTKECYACDDIKYYPGPDSTECERCEDPNMTRTVAGDYECVCGDEYTTGGDRCIPDEELVDIINGYPLEVARAVTYPSLETSSSTGEYTLPSSSTFDYFYLKSAWECSLYRFLEGCEVLANLCVLEQYNEESTVCQLYEDITDGITEFPSENTELDAGWKEGMPWIYYMRDAEDVIESKRVEMEVTFDPDHEEKVHQMKYFLAVFSMDGTYQGAEELTDEFILCPHSSEDTENFKNFGTNTVIGCTIDIEPFLSDDETLFYEMFLEDSTGELWDIPVLITNFIDSDGDEPNSSKDRGDWRLVRRFFIYDNISGIEGTDGYIEQKTTSVLTYPTEIILEVELRTDEDERIYNPFLSITYNSRLTSYIEEENEDYVRFLAEYTMDVEEVWLVALIMVFVTLVFVVLIWVVLFYVIKKGNPSRYARGVGLKAVTAFVGVWSFIFFWYLFFFSGYWFIFYKLQYHVYILIPSIENYEENYQPFEIIFGFVLSLQILWVIFIILGQSKVDFLLIDWEQPKRIPKVSPEMISSVIEGAEIGSTTDYIPVNAWRIIFVANEFNELQSYRYISIEFTLLFLLFFLTGIGWEQLGTAQPNANTGEDHSSPRNPILQFFLTSFLFLVIGYGQVVLRKLIKTWFATPFQNFIDLLSVSNISMFILDDTLHGYYIHGKSTSGNSDVALDELLKQLDKEAKGETKSRGLSPDEDKELETFEVYVSGRLRQYYDEIYEEQNQVKSEEGKTLIYGYEDLQAFRLRLNDRIIRYMTMIIEDAKTEILEKSALERFLNMPPTNMENLEGAPFFYKDKALDVERIFFMGREFSLLLLDLLVFALFDLTTENAFIAAVCTYLVSKAVVELRKSMGESNLAKKTQINKQFLL